MGSIEAVWFGFFSPEEVRKQSFVNITYPSLLDSVD
ncbi:hypothetical protein TIFTF001_056060 [Ficus carica]|uniref:DNA-directed RNA polymerase n=1 Tax=Ficus carica TaxID=3494 RepID=A0AA88EEJ2_FICCA|nr:hypothetical protein TIFTF001_056060 [Ficus carica]